MKPTTDEAILKYKEAKKNNWIREIAYWKGFFQGRLDVLEEWHTMYHEYKSCYHTNKNLCLKEKDIRHQCLIFHEIAKIKEAQK